MSARSICLSILEQVLYNKGKLNQLTDEMCMKASLDDRDQRFVRRLCFGVTERFVLLKAVLKQYTEKDPGSLRPRVQIILCMALYEIFYMNTRDYAVISEALKLAEKRGFRNLKGFINGVLRTVLRNRETAFNGLSEQELSCLPEYLWECLNAWYGKENAKKISEAFLLPSSDITVRRMVSSADFDSFSKMLLNDEIHYEVSPLGDSCLFLSGMKDISHTEVFKKGLIYIQDLSSQMDAFFVNDLTERRTLKILDACASPGGKSICVYDDSHQESDVISCDISDNKVGLINENLRRLGFSEIHTEVIDATVFVPEYEEAFDLVIADVPCSGIGTIRKKPDIRYNIREEYLTDLCELQNRILINVSRYVKPGGTLLYSTCTINPDENRGQIDSFLKTTDNFVISDLTLKVPEGLDAVYEGPDILLFPKEHTDGFYICRLERKHNT